MSDCPVCHGLDIEETFFRREGGRYVRMVFLQKQHEIQQAAHGGCSMCGVLVKGIQAFGSHGPSHIIFHTGMPLRLDGQGIDIEFYVRSGAPGFHVLAGFVADGK
jgi:hypothetical protein